MITNVGLSQLSFCLPDFMAFGLHLPRLSLLASYLPVGYT